MAEPWPEFIESEAQLESVLTTPSAELVQAVGQLSSPLVVLGAGGKMGPTLALLAQRASQIAGQNLEVVAVSRFYSDPHSRDWLDRHGITTIAADFLRADDLRLLPDSPNVVYLVGMKFGTATNPGATWVANTVVPALVAQRYERSRIVALSTGNVYPLTSVAAGGSRESDPLVPLGEYANAAVARERIFEYYSGVHQTQVALLRLSYAVDLRYGVLVDLARKVWLNQPISLETGHCNAIWQGDANDMILRAFPLCAAPPTAVNLTSPYVISIREAAERLGQLLTRVPRFVGKESGTAFVSNTQRMLETLGAPRLTWDRLLAWAAHWVAIGGRSLNKPTHFETRDGKY